MKLPVSQYIWPADRCLSFLFVRFSPRLPNVRTRSKQEVSSLYFCCSVVVLLVGVVVVVFLIPMWGLYVYWSGGKCYLFWYSIIFGSFLCDEWFLHIDPIFSRKIFGSMTIEYAKKRKRSIIWETNGMSRSSQAS